MTLDSSYFVKRAVLNFPKKINLNFVDYMLLEQQFNRAEDGTRLLAHESITVEFKLTEGQDGIFARRVADYEQYSFAPTAEADLFTGYIPTSKEAPLFYIGPMNATISGNTLEGVRIRAGGMTTAWLNPHLFGKGYIAYRFKDERLKGLAEIEYSFKKKKEYANEFQPESYSLMNAMEFMNDEYFSWDVTYFFNGWLFNRIPLLKKLKWREIVSCRGLYGHLSDKNNPAITDGLFAFPIAGTRTMGKTPYVEVGVGIENIFKVLRLDYVWRLTYRDSPDIDRSGLRISLHMTF